MYVHQTTKYVWQQNITKTENTKYGKQKTNSTEKRNWEIYNYGVYFNTPFSPNDSNIRPQITKYREDLNNTINRT